MTKLISLTGILLAITILAASCAGLAGTGPSIQSIQAEVIAAPSSSPALVAAPDGRDVRVSVNLQNFNLVEAAGQANSPGQGRLRYYLDTMPSTDANAPPIGTFIDSAAAAYTWPQVKPGTHIFAVVLVNNDGTVLVPPVVAAAVLTVNFTSSSPAATAWPAASPAATTTLVPPTVIITSPTPTPLISPTPTPPPIASPAPARYTLTVNIIDNGIVTRNPDQPTYAPGTVVKLTWAPGRSDVAFLGWSGDLTGKANDATIVMDSNKVVTATFLTYEPPRPALEGYPWEGLPLEQRIANARAAIAENDQFWAEARELGIPSTMHYAATAGGLNVLLNNLLAQQALNSTPSASATPNPGG